MLVIISDLHFREEASDFIAGDNGRAAVFCRRNLPAAPYRRFIAALAAEAQRNGATRLDLVLAGDIFDIHRTAVWFQGQPQTRPYQNASDVDSILEAKVIEIVEAIAQEPDVAETLLALRLLANGRYQLGLSEEDFPVPVQIHYIPGNHDRLAHATPAIRRTIRELLGMAGGGAPFPRSLAIAPERALIRHGHEYDAYNFAVDHRQTAEFPASLPPEQYDAPAFGDFVTVDVASRLPYLFRRHHGDEAIRSNPTLRAVYLRLLEFDDLRPQSAMLTFLLQMPEEGLWPEDVWATIEPAIQHLLDAIHDDPYLHDWLGRLNRHHPLGVVGVVRLLLRLRAWRWLKRIPLWLVRLLANRALQQQREAADEEQFAVRESTIRSGENLFLVSGHTHKPRVNLLYADEKGERYYVDTGTWRNQIPASPDFNAFGRLKSLTYVIIYGPDEDQGNPPQAGKIASLDFWSGVTQRWGEEKGEG